MKKTQNFPTLIPHLSQNFLVVAYFLCLLQGIKKRRNRCYYLVSALYPGRDLNPHDRNGHRILSPACLPVPPPGRYIKKTSLFTERISLSGRRDSNPRPRPWQGRALPTELLPHNKFWNANIIQKVISSNIFYYKKPI